MASTTAIALSPLPAEPEGGSGGPSASTASPSAATAINTQPSSPQAPSTATTLAASQTAVPAAASQTGAQTGQPATTAIDATAQGRLPIWIRRARPIWSRCWSSVTFTIATIGLFWAIRIALAGLGLQRWSARNDSLQSCLALESHSAYCNATIKAGVSAPPGWKRSRLEDTETKGIHLVEQMLHISPLVMAATIALTVGAVLIAAVYSRPRTIPFPPRDSPARSQFGILQDLQDSTLVPEGLPSDVSSFMVHVVKKTVLESTTSFWSYSLKTPQKVSTYPDRRFPLSTDRQPIVQDVQITLLSQGYVSESEEEDEWCADQKNTSTPGTTSSTLLVNSQQEEGSDDELPTVSLDFQDRDDNAAHPPRKTLLSRSPRDFQYRYNNAPDPIRPVLVRIMNGKDKEISVKSPELRYLHERLWRAGEGPWPYKAWALGQLGSSRSDKLRSASLTSLLGLSSFAAASPDIFDDLPQSPLSQLKLPRRETEQFRSDIVLASVRISDLWLSNRLYLRLELWDEISRRDLSDPHSPNDIFEEPAQPQDEIVRALLEWYATLHITLQYDKSVPALGKSHHAKFPGIDNRERAFSFWQEFFADQFASLSRDAEATEGVGGVEKENKS